MSVIDLDKSGYQVNIFLISLLKHILKRLAEALLMSTHNICFRGEIRKISIHLDWKKHLYWGYISTPQPLFNTVAGIQNRNCVS